MSLDVLTRDELAERWGVSPRTLDNYRSQGFGPAFIKPRHKLVLYLASDVEHFEAEGLTPRGVRKKVSVDTVVEFPTGETV